MPLIDLYVPAGRLATDARQRLGAELTQIVAGHEQVPDNELNRKLSWLHIHEQPSGTVLIGGEVADHTDPRYRVIVHCQQGYLDEEHRRAVARDVGAAIRAADPDLPTDVPRLFCTIDEVPDGNRGVENAIVRAAESVDLLGITDERIRTAAKRLAEEADDAVGVSA